MNASTHERSTYIQYFGFEIHYNAEFANETEFKNLQNEECASLKILFCFIQENNCNFTAIATIFSSTKFTYTKSMNLIVFRFSFQWSEWIGSMQIHFAIFLIIEIDGNEETRSMQWIAKFHKLFPKETHQTAYRTVFGIMVANYLILLMCKPIRSHSLTFIQMSQVSGYLYTRKCSLFFS